MLAVPMLREGFPIGVLALTRSEVRPFSDRQIELVGTFADQAAIAIENVRLFEEIQDKSRQLEAASQHKSQFLANMSHELRTPLNAIIGVTEMLQEDARDLEREDEIEPLDRVLRAARHLLTLINDILDLSKIEAGRMELHLELFPLAPLIEDVVDTIKPLAAKNGNRIVVDCGPGLGTVHADQTRLRQALLNLTSNAGKFTENGTITIRARRRPPPTLPRKRGRDREGDRERGLDRGDGERYRHRHDPRADDQAVQGILPGRRLDHAPIRRHRSRPRHQPAFLPHDGRRHRRRQQAGRGLDLHHPAAAGRAQCRPPTRPGGRPAKAAAGGRRRGGAPLVLVVDDDPTVRELVARHLERAAFAVVTARQRPRGTSTGA